MHGRMVQSIPIVERPSFLILLDVLVYYCDQVGDLEGPSFYVAGMQRSLEWWVNKCGYRLLHISTIYLLVYNGKIWIFIYVPPEVWFFRKAPLSLVGKFINSWQEVGFVLIRSFKKTGFLLVRWHACMKLSFWNALCENLELAL